MARAVPGVGWRIRDNTARKFWGNPFRALPGELLAELNGERRPEVVNRLNRGTIHEKGQRP